MHLQKLLVWRKVLIYPPLDRHCADVMLAFGGLVCVERGLVYVGMLALAAEERLNGYRHSISPIRQSRLPPLPHG